MAKKFANTRTVALRQEEQPKESHLPRVHRKFLLALLEACLCEKVGFYVGPYTPYGSNKIRFYAGDENLEDFISKHDDPAVEVGRVAERLFGAQITREVLTYGASLEAQERSRGSETMESIPRVLKTKIEP